MINKAHVVPDLVMDSPAQQSFIVSYYCTIGQRKAGQDVRCIAAKKVVELRGVGHDIASRVLGSILNTTVSLTDVVAMKIWFRSGWVEEVFLGPPVQPVRVTGVDVQYAMQTKRFCLNEVPLVREEPVKLVELQYAGQTEQCVRLNEVPRDAAFQYKQELKAAEEEAAKEAAEAAVEEAAE